MGIKIKLPSSILRFTGDQSVVEVQGNNVGECLNHLQARFPDLKTMLFNDNGELRALFDVYVNNTNTYPEGLGYDLKDGDEILLITIIGGG